MNKIIPYILFAFLALTGCERFSSTGKIGFRVRSVDTKGTVITTDNIAEKYGSFVTDVWLADGYASDAAPDGHYVDKGKVVYDTGKWSLEKETFWLNETELCFWSWAPDNVTERTGITPDNQNKTLGFKYSLPSVANQKDLLFAFNAQKYSESDPKDYVDIVFYHALAWVKFMINTNDGTFNPALQITNIQMTNIYSAADCLFQPLEVNTEDLFRWTAPKTPKAFSLGFSMSDFSVNTPNGKVTTNEKAFFLIPQTTSSDAQLNITFKVNSTTSVSKSVNLGGEVWKPGYYYTYKIKATSIDRPVEVECIVHDWIEKDEISLE